MLTLLDPSVLHHFEVLPTGVQPFRNLKTGKLFMCIKASKEAILAAKLNGGFKFYVAPLPSPWGTMPVLMTAFFDDADEPLLITTPLFDDEMPVHLKELVAYEELQVHFLDEHNREWAAYRARLTDGGSCMANGTDLTLKPYSEDLLFQIFHFAKRWFGDRDAADDARAISVDFIEPLLPDLVITDMDAERNDYIGSAGFAHVDLERERPGPPQERDIIGCLKRIYPGDQVVFSPKRSDTGNEFVDVLVTTDTHLLLFQAKDSPNTKPALGRTIERKRKTAIHQLRKAVDQSRGAVRFAQANPILDLRVGEDEPYPIAVGRRQLYSIVVIKEMFEHDHADYLKAFMALSELGGGVVLDYAAFDQFTFRLRGPDLLLQGLETYAATSIEAGGYVEAHTFLLALTAQGRSGWG